MTLSLAEFFDEKEDTTDLERVAFLLRLSIVELWQAKPKPSIKQQTKSESIVI